MWYYNKKDKEMTNPIHTRQAVRYKRLYDAADRLLRDINKISNTLMFSGEDIETKRYLYAAEDSILKFQDNLSVKDSISKD